jgi:hypothetical protein
MVWKEPDAVSVFFATKLKNEFSSPDAVDNKINMLKRLTANSIFVFIRKKLLGEH